MDKLARRDHAYYKSIMNSPISEISRVPCKYYKSIFKTEEESVNRTCVPSDALGSKAAASSFPLFCGCEIGMVVTCGQCEYDVILSDQVP